MEVKINPIGALFGAPDVSAEFILNDSFGIEAKTGFVFRNNDVTIFEDTATDKTRGFSIAVIPKYYFSPDRGADKFYAGLYSKFQTLSLERDLCVLAGYKWVGSSGILLDINAGLGRALLNSYKSDVLDDETLEGLDILNLDFIGTSPSIFRITRLFISYTF